MNIMKRVTCVVAIGLAATAGGCEKSKSDASDKAGMGRASQVGTKADLAMLADLPSGNQLLFGGNFMRLQKFMQDSPLAKLSSAINSKTPGADAWQKCFTDGPGISMIGAVAYTSGAIDIRYVMKGMDIDQVEKCAKTASFPETMDADHKFVSIELKNSAANIKTGYLVLADGALYARMTMALGGHLAMFPTVDRPMLEADVAQTKNKGGTAADDSVLTAALPDVDQTKPIWFVASGAGTPIASDVGIVTGTFDVTDGLSLDITAHVLDASLASQITDGVAKAKAQAGMLGEEAAAIAKDTKFDRKDDALHLQIAVTNAQLDALTKKLAPLMGGARAPQPETAPQLTP
jgi:hypothetical protein